MYESEYVLEPNGAVIPANLTFHDSLKPIEIPTQITADEYRSIKRLRQKVLGEDLIFALDQLLKLEKYPIDTRKVAVFGHSLGGATAIYAALLDSRFKAVVDLDGTPPSLALEQGLEVPFCFIEDLVDYKNHPGYKKQFERRSALCSKNKGQSFRIMLANIDHDSFMDIHYRFAQNEAEKRGALQILQLTADLMEQFFKAYLYGTNWDIPVH